MDRKSKNGNSFVRSNTRPQGLRGKEIGMYYKNLSRQKREEKVAEPMKLGPCIDIPKNVLATIDSHLHNFEISAEEEQVSAEFNDHYINVLKYNFDEFIEQEQTKYSQMSGFNNEVLNQRMKSQLLAKESDDEFRKRYKKRLNLPTMTLSERILSIVQANQIVLIVGSTGCGKTTQIPQLLLDEYIYGDKGSQCRIVCTQPRRISAVSVAERVAYERCENLGTSVGYQIRLESKLPREHGSILYCTTGILLQKMQSDPLMKGISAVILDEIHERTVETDLLMALLKMILPYRLDLKVILMSATVAEQEISEYFDNCAMLRIEGTIYPVKVLYLEDILQETGFTKFQVLSILDGNKSKHKKKGLSRQSVEKAMLYNAIIEPYLKQIRDKYDASVIQALHCSDSEGCNNLQFLEYLIFYICEHKPPGAILVFLPSYDKISKLNTILENPTLPLGQRFQQRIQVHSLHSMLQTTNQKQVFQPAPLGIRKIILSTNIAETSVTIEDIVYVINTGRMKVSAYDAEMNIQTLTEQWITKANSQQRKGRAGRLQPGVCYNLFTRARERTMDDLPKPEILCCKMEQIILRLKILHISNPFDFLKRVMNPPPPTAINNGISLLKRIDALDNNCALTPLGMHLARLPIDPQMAKMLLMAALFHCFEPITSVVASLSYKSPFQIQLGQEKKVDRIKNELSVNSKSDHLMIDNMILQFREAHTQNLARDFCYKNFINFHTVQQLENMKRQLTDVLKDANFIDSSQRTCNINSNNIALLRAIIAAGLYPNIAFLRRAKKIRNRVDAIHSMSTPEEKRVNFHPSSVNSGELSFNSNYFVYFQKQKSTAVHIMDSTMVFPLALLIFGDGVETGVTPDNVHYISVAKTYHFKCNVETADIILKLRNSLDSLLQKKAVYPSPILPDSAEELVIKAIQIVLSINDVYQCEDECGDDVGDYCDVLIDLD